MVTFVRSRQACLIQRGMSALGQKRTYAVQKGMSALPPKADMCGALAHVRFVPKADKRRLIRSPCWRGAISIEES
jgi:hypothetical protein